LTSNRIVSNSQETPGINTVLLTQETIQDVRQDDQDENLPCFLSNNQICCGLTICSKEKIQLILWFYDLKTLKEVKSFLVYSTNRLEEHWHRPAMIQMREISPESLLIYIGMKNSNQMAIVDHKNQKTTFLDHIQVSRNPFVKDHDLGSEFIYTSSSGEFYFGSSKVITKYNHVGKKMNELTLASHNSYMYVTDDIVAGRCYRTCSLISLSKLEVICQFPFSGTLFTITFFNSKIYVACETEIYVYHVNNKEWDPIERKWANDSWIISMCFTNDSRGKDVVITGHRDGIRVWPDT
jgi:hypothetical protein